jgi:Lipid A core - O-antigen ligase and related enzymes
MSNKTKGNMYKKSTKAPKMYSQQEDSEFNYAVIPVFILLCIIPFITKLYQYNPGLSQYIWFPNNQEKVDLFLYYKQWTFVLLSAVLVIVIAIKLMYDKKEISVSKIFIPLAIYGLLALFSGFAANNTSFAFFGSYEQFESTFALLGYCIVAYYSYLFIKNDRSLEKIFLYILIQAIVMGALGLSQFLKHDFFHSRIGRSLIFPLIYRDTKMTDVFGAGRVYLSQFNPNYVGVYISLIIPIIVCMLFFQKKISKWIVSLVAIFGLVICEIGSRSVAAIMAMGVAFLFIIIFMRKYILKRIYIVIPCIVIAGIGLVVAGKMSNVAFMNKISEAFKNVKSFSGVTQMDTNDTNISLTYNGNKMTVEYYMASDQTSTFVLADENKQQIAFNYDTTNNTFQPTDERFAGIVFGARPEYKGIFYIQADGAEWDFTNMTGDGKYYFVNKAGKIDKLDKKYPSAIFTGYERMASGRGYIWSRTIPLLKNYIILGCGADNFVTIFPQQDYVNMAKYGFAGSIMTKPHSMYLQIAAQTGLLSLIAFLAFYLIYFVTSIRLYIKSSFQSVSEQMGVAIFVGTISYMVAGITNDSSITTAPIFWTLLGVGFAVNRIVKQKNQEKIA